jgi:hypothetical protein
MNPLTQAQTWSRKKNYPLRRLRKKDKIKARETRGAGRTSCTPQQPRDETQRRDWPSCKVVGKKQGRLKQTFSLPFS